ncbi:hypothetical protein VCHC47A1_2597, partial [Vibrio cholerae HC-47A1]
MAFGTFNKNQLGEGIKCRAR